MESFIVFDSDTMRGKHARLIGTWHPHAAACLIVLELQQRVITMSIWYMSIIMS